MTEAAQPSRPISSPTQPPRLLPATWGRSIPSSSQVGPDRGGEVGGARLDPVGKGRRRAEARHVEDDHLALGLEQPDDRLPDDAAAAEAVQEQQRLAPRLGQCHSGREVFANRAWTSPMRRSRKPASEELR